MAFLSEKLINLYLKYAKKKKIKPTLHLVKFDN